jgi:hypothetical protein
MLKLILAIRSSFRISVAQSAAFLPPFRTRNAPRMPRNLRRKLKLNNHPRPVVREYVGVFRRTEHRRVSRFFINVFTNVGNTV